MEATSPTAEHPNAKLVREGLEAFDRRDIQAYADLIADDIVWHQIGAPDLHGKQAMAEQMSVNTGDYDITAEVHDVIANDEHAIALVNATAHRDGREFRYRTAEIMHIRDGKLVERWAFSDDTEAIKNFFA
jgi:ketosteroid isomerase-like protein